MYIFHFECVNKVWISGVLGVKLGLNAISMCNVQAFVQRQKTISDFVICCLERSSASDCICWFSTFPENQGVRTPINRPWAMRAWYIPNLWPLVALYLYGTQPNGLNVANQRLQSLALLRSAQQITKSHIVFRFCTKAHVQCT